MSTPAPENVYGSCMTELRERLGIIREVAQGRLGLGTNQFTYELVSLHFRKALELIAFGSLAAHKEKYAEVHAKYHEHWNARRLLECIEKVHPEFYPRPVRLAGVDEGGVKRLEPLIDGFLTRDQFVTLYELTSDVLHTRNPFSQRERAINFGVTVAEWLDRFYQLLNLHAIQLAGNPNVWLVQMKGEDGRVHVFPAAETHAVGAGA